MADWEKLRELTHEVAPPDFGSMVRTAERRTRRARIAGAALASMVLVAGAVGIRSLDRTSDDPVEPAKDPTPSLTKATDGLVALPGPDPGKSYADLEAGRYRVPLSDTLSFDVDLPDETSAHDDGLFISTGPVVLKVAVADQAYGVPHDPCTAHTLDHVGGGVDGLARAIHDQPVYHATSPEPIRLGGADGVYTEVRIPPTYDASACEDGTVASPGTSTTSYPWDRPFRANYAILDVEGQRVVVAQECTCSEARLDNAADIARSITFTETSGP